MSLRRRAFAGALWSTAESLGQLLVQFGVFLVLARLLGPEEYGLIGLCVIVTTIADVAIVNGGWAEALIQRRRLEEGQAASVFWFLLATASLLALTIAALAPLAASAFAQPALRELLPWLCLSLPLRSLSVVPGALLRRELRLAPLAARSMLAVLCGGAIAIPMAVAGFGVWSLVAYQLVQPLVAAVVLWLACDWRPAPAFSSTHVRELRGYVSGVLAERTLFTADLVLPRIFIGYLFGATVLGYFTFARKILELCALLLSKPLYRVALSAVAAVRGDRERLQGLLTFGAQLSALLAFPIYLGLAAAAPELVTLVFGAQWAPSVPVVQILALVGLVTPLTRLGTALLHGLGRIRWQFLSTLIGSLLLTGLLVAVAHVGMIAIAGAMLLRAFLMLPVQMAILRSATRIDVGNLLRAGLPMLSAALLMAAIVLAWRYAVADLLQPPMVLAGSLVFGAMTYVGALLVVSRPLLRRAASIAGSDLRGPAS